MGVGASILIDNSCENKLGFLVHVLFWRCRQGHATIGCACRALTSSEEQRRTHNGNQFTALQVYRRPPDLGVYSRSADPGHVLVAQWAADVEVTGYTRHSLH